MRLAADYGGAVARLDKGIGVERLSNRRVHCKHCERI